jgi:Spy/CpxP family protein refolding chaperone
MKSVWARAAPVFLLGLALGAVAGSWGQRAVIRRRMQGDPNHQRMMLDKLSRELSLDEKQKAAISAVMDSKKTDIDRLKTETFARLESIRTSADAEMAKVLTPEQAAKLESMHRARPMRINWETPTPAPVPAL